MAFFSSSQSAPDLCLCPHLRVSAACSPLPSFFLEFQACLSNEGVPFQIISNSHMTQFNGHFQGVNVLDLLGAFHFLLLFSLTCLYRCILFCLPIKCWASSGCAWALFSLYCSCWNLIHAHCSVTTHKTDDSQIYPSSLDFSKLHIIVPVAHMASLGYFRPTMFRKTHPTFP